MNKNKGLTLIEMMIALVIGLLVVGTVMTIFVTNVRSFRDNVAMSKLNQELRGVMTFISDEVKRTGYSADPENSDFMQEFILRTQAGCLRYSYDEDHLGTRNTTGDVEGFGFRLDAVDNTIEWARNLAPTDNCPNTANWAAITDPDIATITAFDITNYDDSALPIVPFTAGNVEIYQLKVSITGQTNLSNNDVASRTITEVIRVRNDET